MNKSMLWIGVIVALLIGIFAGYSYAKSQSSSEMMMVKESMQKQLDETKMSNEKMMKEAQMKQDEEAKMQPTGAMMEEEKSSMTGKDK